MTITDDEALGARAAVYVDKGCDWTEDRQYRLRYAFIAPCYRMTELQGAVLCSQLDRLEWITRNLLDLSRFDAGLVALDLADHSAAVLLEAALSAFQALAGEKGIALLVSQPEPALTLR